MDDVCTLSRYQKKTKKKNSDVLLNSSTFINAHCDFFKALHFPINFSIRHSIPLSGARFLDTIISLLKAPSVNKTQLLSSCRSITPSSLFWKNF